MALAVQHLNRVFQRFSSDERITPWHISLYMGLFYHWVSEGFTNPLQVSRSRLMELSSIQSIVTYHKCIRQLQEFGYIDYFPSYHPIFGSRICFLLIKNTD